MKKPPLNLFGLFALLLSCSFVYADPEDSTRVRRWYYPAFIPIQFAGNIGFLSTGIGFTSHTENYDLALLYGFVPSSVSQVSIHKISARNVFPLYRYFQKSNQTVLPYLGFTVSVELGKNAFLRQPSHFPKSYYDFPKAIHATAFGGIKMQHVFESDFRSLRGIEFYAEAGTVDVYMWYKVISDEIKLKQIFSLALGVNFLLPR